MASIAVLGGKNFTHFHEIWSAYVNVINMKPLNPVYFESTYYEDFIDI